MQQPPNYPQQPYGFPQVPPPPPKKKRRVLPLIIGAAILIVALIACIAVATSASSGTSNSTPTAQPTNPPTQAAAPRYPPKSKADLHGLAALGDSSAIHAFHRESVGLVGACPQPKVEATVAPPITGKKLAEDMLAYFYSANMDSPCGSVLFVNHKQSDVSAGAGYTAGRVDLSVTDSSGQPNTDPHGQGLSYTVTLDMGAAIGPESEYAVKY